jgi:hypothetical protein
LITLLITEQAKQEEWNTILTTAKNSGFPPHNIHTPRNILISKTQCTFTTQTHQKKKWITFTYHSPLIYKVNNLLKLTNLNIAFHATKSIYKILGYKIMETKQILVGYTK